MANKTNKTKQNYAILSITAVAIIAMHIHSTKDERAFSVLLAENVKLTGIVSGDPNLRRESLPELAYHVVARARVPRVGYR